MKNNTIPLVTVLIPVYNAEQYLWEALQSVSKQTFKDFEILVIDDGSTDRSPQLLEAYKQTDHRVRIVRQPNSGISSALNLGLSLAHGKLIVRMDSDDIMLPNRIEVQVAYLSAHPKLAFCACQMNLIDHRGRIFGAYLPRPTCEADLAKTIKNQLPIVFTHPTVTYRVAAVRAIGGYDSRCEPCEDMDLFGRLILSGHAGLVIPKLLMHYRVHATSISGSKIAVQLRAQEFVRAAFYARRNGGDLDYETHITQALTAPWYQRIRKEACLHSDILKRKALYYRAAGHLGCAGLCMLLAAAFRPWPAIIAVWNRAVKF